MKKFADVETMIAALTDEEIAEIGKELNVDYSHTTWKEAKYMICEDYINTYKESKGMERNVIDLIGNWDGTFEKLCKALVPNDLYELMEETSFRFVDYDCMADALEEGYFSQFIHLYIEDWLMCNLDDGVAGKTTNNLFRLWNEWE